MSTILNKTDGTVLTEIADGALDQTSTDLAFIGKLYRNYGELVNENFVRLLENFANDSSPGTPLIGQLWYDTDDKNLKVYKDSGFVTLSNNTTSNAEPNSPNIGDFWYDTVDAQLKLYTGTAWNSVSPSHTASQGKTGVFPETITDTTATDHVVNKVYISDTVVAVYNKDNEFTPQSAINGFSSIKTGLNLSSIANFKLHGTATSAELLNSFDGSEFLQFDANQTTSGSLTIENTTPLTLGTSNEFSIETGAGSTDLTRNSSGDIKLVGSSGATILAASVNNQVLIRDGSTSVPSLAFIDDVDTGISRLTDNEIDIVAGGTVRVKINSTQTEMTGDVVPAANDSYDLGAVGAIWATVYADTLNGTAVEALYADLAEKYTTEKNHPTGTVMAICDHTDHEACPADQSQIPMGVVSENPAYLMNKDIDGQALALKGRVPVRVHGAVHKGQAVYAWEDGIASTDAADHMVGIALETNTDAGEKLVECVLKL